MATKTISSLHNPNQKFGEENLVDYYPIDGDYGHLGVKLTHYNGKRETIGYVYSEVDGEQSRFISTNAKGREIFPPTSDFNTVTQRFEKYARQIAIDKGPTYSQFQKDNYSLTKNPNQMKTQSQTTEQKPKKVNQLIFTEYEKPAGDGHFITVNDSYHNVIGRIHKSYNEELRKYEYLAYDYAGNQMGTNDKLWQLKKEFTDNRDLLLEQAHIRRIAAKEKVKETPQQIPQERMSKYEKSRLQTNENVQSKPNPNRQEEREQELEDLRDDRGDDRDDREIAF